MSIIRLAKVDKAIELYYKQQCGGLGDFMEAAHTFNELNKEEKREMMIILGFNMNQIENAMKEF